MKIIILGHTGMLGRYVHTYLSMNFDNVFGLSRDQFDALYSHPEELDLVKGDVVINCMGLIKQRKDTSDLEMIMINTVFPRHLADHCEERGARLIHPSTDCCFSGLNGPYSETDAHDALDVYGKSKSLGEPPNATVMRTSIIGEEIGNNRSLIEWVKSKKNQTVDGYVNHLWSGITCLEFAKICENMITNNIFWQGAKNIHSPEPISKYDLVCNISIVWDLDIKVNPIETPVKCNRSLITSKGSPWFHMRPYMTQLYELKNFGNYLFS